MRVKGHIRIKFMKLLLSQDKFKFMTSTAKLLGHIASAGVVSSLQACQNVTEFKSLRK